MSRIATQAANTILLSRIFDTQQTVFRREVQTTTEKKAQEYQGISRDSRRLVNVENARAQLKRFVSNNEQVDVRLNITATVVEEFRKTVSNFRKDLRIYAIGDRTDHNRVQFIQKRAHDSLKTIQNLLNTDVDGRFLFAGSRTDREAVDLDVTTFEAFQEKYDGARVKYPETARAHLENFSINSDTNNSNKPFITSGNFLTFRRDADGDSTTPGTSTIEASSPMFANVAAGTYITVTNTADNNGAYTVDSVSPDGRTITVRTEMLTDEADTAITITYPDPDRPKDTLILPDAEFGPVTFSRAGNTITTTKLNGFSSLPVGSKFTVSNSVKNDGTYTVSAKTNTNSGTVITIESKKLTDEGVTSANSAGQTFFDYPSDTHVVFNAGSGTIKVTKNDSMTAVPGVFNGLAVGNQLTVAGTGGANDRRVTITEISADGSTITVSEPLANQTDNDGVTFAGANAVDFNYTSHTQLVFADNGAGDVDTIQVQTNPGGVAVAGVFDNLSVGQTFTVTAGANAGTYTIGAISSDGSTLRLAGERTVDADGKVTFPDATLQNETNTAGAELDIYSVDGTISATPYFNGDQRSLIHRVDDDRTIDLEIFAAFPGFEKAIRGISQILQGKAGSEGGLDQNRDRPGQVEYLLESSLERTVSGTAPFGAETSGSMEQLEIDLGFDRVLVNDTNKFHKELIGFLETEIINLENVDLTEALTKLLDDQRALEASFQVFTKVRQLSLINFI